MSEFEAHGRVGALTGAERQRRHRAKRKAEAVKAAHDRSSGATAVVFAECQQLRNRVEALERNLSEAKPLRRERDALQGQLDTVRGALLTLLPRLSPAGRQQLRHYMRSAGYGAWFDSS